ncbi:zinc finger protein 665 [Biomphalaria glabrata]|nr:zinc finger protein 665-like [Biomphalaria glabrata]KAI8793503.1 zinc finger protein 665 [Biomphalaria glabrata]
MENGDLSCKEEINSIASLLRTFLPDHDDIPLNGSTEQLLKQVGEGLNSSNSFDINYPTASLTSDVEKRFDVDTPFSSQFNLKNKNKQKRTKEKRQNGHESKKTSNHKSSQMVVQPAESSEDVDSDATIDMAYSEMDHSFEPTESNVKSIDNKTNGDNPFSTDCIKHYACFLCDEIFTDLDVYSQHMIGHSQELVSIKCHDCNESFANKTQYSSHRRLSTYELWVDRNKLQELIAPLKEESEGRTSKKADETEESYICSVCGNMYFKYYSFLKHMEEHKDSNAFLCAVCHEAFKSPCLLRYHVDLLHSHVQPYQCRRCLRRFKMKGSLSTHLRYCDVEPGSNPFAEEMQFIDHLSQQRKFLDMEKDDMDQSQFSCPICTFMFDTPEELQNHMNYHDEIKPYKCEECGRGFRSKNVLQKHMQLHKTNHDCKCEICGVQLITRSGYNAHLRGHRNQEIIQASLMCDSSAGASKENPGLEPALEILQRFKEKTESKYDEMRQSEDGSTGTYQLPKAKVKTYPCPLCGMMFHSGGAKFQAHAKKVHKDAEFIKCTKCTKCFLGKENLDRHIKLHKMYTETFPCDECGKTFRRKYALLVHKRMHTFKKFLKCDICGQEFRFVSEVDKHKNHKHRYDRILNIYKCNICGQRFPMLSHLSVHCYCHNVPESKPFECDLCKNCFRTSIELKQHIYKKHEELMKKHGDSRYISNTGTLLTTPKAEVSVASEPDIKKEVIDEDEKDSKDEKLSDASEVTIPQDGLGQEAKKVGQVDETIHNLENNGYDDTGLPSNVDVYNWVTRQFYHQAKVLKRWTCEVCDKAFSSNSDLKTHRRTHSGETPFKCDYCERSFKQRGHRKLHIQVVHTKDMPFKCNQCESAFPTRYRYQVHLKRHTGVREHNCAHCDKGYYTLGKLNEHKKKRHAAEWEEEQANKIIKEN